MQQQPAFQQAINRSQVLIGKIDQDQANDAEIKTQISELLEELASARGFFVSLLTGDWKFDQEIPAIVLDCIRENPEHAYNLLAKNLVMSSATLVSHRKTSNDELAEGSQRVIDRTTAIIKALNEAELTQEVSDILQAVEDKLTNKVTTGGNAGTYGAFLERWSYNDEQMLVAADNLKTAIGRRADSKKQSR